VRDASAVCNCRVVGYSLSGLFGCFDRRLATGGGPFGYRTSPIVAGHDAHGHPITQGYQLEVDSELAPVVVRLFEGYARKGLGLGALAHLLNGDGYPSPRKSGWCPTAIREMLRNPIYRGERVWNRSSWLKDHETGKRRRFERPESEWVRQQESVARLRQQADDPSTGEGEDRAHVLDP